MHVPAPFTSCHQSSAFFVFLWLLFLILLAHSDCQHLSCIFQKHWDRLCNGNSFLSRVSQAGCIFRISCSCFDQTPGPLQSSSPPKQCTIGPAGASEPCEAQCPTRVIYVHIEIYSMIYITRMQIRISPCLTYPACLAA